MEQKKLKKIFSYLYCPVPENLFFENPVQPGNELHYGVNPNYCYTGYHYDKEMFYLIDLPEVKKNKYVISSYGRIFTFTNNKQMNPSTSGGYLRIGLKLENNKTKMFNVHKLVAMTFLPKTIEEIEKGKDIINHKDTIKTNNYYKNLEWVTHSENTIHTHENNVHSRTKIMNIYLKDIITHREKQERNKTEPIGMTRITDEQVHIICQNLINGKSRAECCIAAGLEPNDNNKTIVSNIAGGRRRNKIAKQYGIIPETKLTKDLNDKKKFVIPVCKLLEKGYTPLEITKMLPIDSNYDRARMFISGIKNRQTYKNITKDYNF